MSRASEAKGPVKDRLQRVLSLRHFVAMGINVGIGGSIYLIGSGIYRLSGTWSLILAGAVGAFLMVVSLVMADVSSRFDSTGGCYVQTRAAFGAFCGFEVAWMLWFTRVTAQASLTNGIATSVGYFSGGTLTTGKRILCSLVVTLGVGLLHMRSARFGARMILSFAVFKLLPLVIVLAAAACLGFIRPVPFCTPPDVSNAITVALLLLFSLSGFEIIAVPAGEGRNPRRDVPLATVLSIGIVLGIWMLLHLTLINTVPNLGSETRPVAASAERLMGPGMGAIVNLSAIVSAVGTCIAIQLAASRSLYAVAVDNLVPGWFAVLNPVQRVPQNAILFSSAAVLLLSACGSFEFLAVASALPRLIIFFSVAASLIRFRHSSAIRATVPASTFALPFGSALAALVMIVCVLVFATASFSQRSLAAVAILVGTFIYVGNAWSRSLTSPSAPR